MLASGVAQAVQLSGLWHDPLRGHPREQAMSRAIRLVPRNKTAAGGKLGNTVKKARTGGRDSMTGGLARGSTTWHRHDRAEADPAAMDGAKHFREPARGDRQSTRCATSEGWHMTGRASNSLSSNAARAPSHQAWLSHGSELEAAGGGQPAAGAFQAGTQCPSRHTRLRA